MRASERERERERTKSTRLPSLLSILWGPDSVQWGMQTVFNNQASIRHYNNLFSQVSSSVLSDMFLLYAGLDFFLLKERNYSKEGGKFTEQKKATLSLCYNFATNVQPDKCVVDI